MTDRPILFSGPMVRAILAGTKTMTRRVIKDRWGVNQALPLHRCPYGVPGDRLWVKEQLRGDGQPGNRRVGIVRYGADGEMVQTGCDCGVVCLTGECDIIRGDVLWGWKRPILPGMFMPRWASRLTLAVEAVRVERVQDISQEDALLEGLPYGKRIRLPHGGEPVWTSTPRSSFADLWDSINAKRRVRIKHGHKIIGEGYPWSSNPWVWVVSFRRVAP